MKRPGARVPPKIREAEDLLRARGLPMTVQRRTILEWLAEREDHPSAEQVYGAVRSRVPGISKTTVYRVLDTLVEVGAVRRVNHLGASVRFDPRTGHHHHLVCTRCDKVIDLEDARVGRLHLPRVKPRGFEVSDFSIHFTGVCVDCREKKSRSRSPRKQGGLS